MKVDDNVFQEKICEDSSSFDLSPADLATAIEELNRLGEKLFEMAKSEETSLVEMTDSSAMPGTVVKHVQRLYSLYFIQLRDFHFMNMQWMFT